MKYTYVLPLLLFLLPVFPACQSTKEAVGNYVTEAVKEQLETRLDQALSQRHLSIAEITSALDQNQDHTITLVEAKDTILPTVKDAVLLEALKYVDGKVAQNDALITQMQSEGLSTTKQEVVSWLLGLVAVYLAKWALLRSKDVKENGKRDARLMVLEKLLNRDIDGDGKIGGNTPESPQVVS